ncbi:hypothetical protein GQ53DRAFT_647119, partial [Thozetella sp. PMI_491]
NLTDIGNGGMSPGTTFLEDTSSGLRAFGSASPLWYIGIWIIKCNFLVFFYRLGNKITSFLIFWRVVLVVVVGCWIVEISIMQFDCMFGNIYTIITTCSSTDALERTYTFFKVSCILDIISDVLIICFPVSNLWKTYLAYKYKYGNISERQLQYLLRG